MITLEQLTELLGWAAILNIGILLFASKMFGIPENDLSIIYFNYLANYKTLSFVFTIAPYIALKIMGQ